MENVKKAVVALSWYDDNMPEMAADGTLRTILNTTGFIFQQDESGIYILTTAHQFPSLFKDTTGLSKDPTQVPNSQFGVTVQFFDRTTTIDGHLLHYDLVKDLALVKIFPSEKLKCHPIPCINSIEISNDQVYEGQSIYAIHHPTMYHVNTHQLIAAFYQYTEGFVADNNYHNIGQVHFRMPLIFTGSSGSPVLDKHSNKLVSMILGWDPYQGQAPDIPFGPNSNVQYRHRGVFVSTIRQFLVEAQAAANPAANPADMII